MKILYIEDDPDIRKIANISLSVIGGFSVEMASSGPEAFNILNDSRPDVVLLDSTLPNMDSKVVFERLKEQMPDLPVVIAASRLSPESESYFRGKGAAGIILKPFDPRSLAAELESCVNGVSSV